MDSTFSMRLTTAAIDQLIADLRQFAPVLADRAATWMNGLSRAGRAADYFQHPLAFPMLLLPLWVEEAVSGQINADFQAALVYSSVSGYYFIRMIDNVMDEASPVERSLLPMTGVFHAQATTTYHQYFEHTHAFWTHFARWNTQSAAFAIEDSSSDDIDLASFQQIAGKKVVAGKIPIAAVLARHDQLDRLPAWEAFYDDLGCWHQFLNDVLSWKKDLQHQTASYFLCEGERRKRADESLFGWLLREGFAWGLATLEHWLDNLHAQAALLESPPLSEYLRSRGDLLAAQRTEMFASLAALSPLIRAQNTPLAEGDPT